jgi:hypothetical protein
MKQDVLLKLQILIVSQLDCHRNVVSDIKLVLSRGVIERRVVVNRQLEVEIHNSFLK